MLKKKKKECPGDTITYNTLEHSEENRWNCRIRIKGGLSEQTGGTGLKIQV